MTGDGAVLPEEVTWGVRHGDSILDHDFRDNWHFQMNWHALLPPTEENVRSHPQWWAREEGGRPTYRPHNVNVCVSNPEVVQMFIDAARKEFDSNPDRVMLSLEANDTSYYCKCKSCQVLKASLGREATMSDVFVDFCNQIAAEVKKTHPNKILGFYAYGSYGGHTYAPRLVEPDPMLAYMMTCIGDTACYRHGLVDTRCPTNSRWRTSFEEWASSLNHRGYYGYWGHFRWCGPDPLTRLVKDLSYLKSQGVQYVCSENRFSWSTNAPFYYLALRLC